MERHLKPGWSGKVPANRKEPDVGQSGKIIRGRRNRKSRGLGWDSGWRVCRSSRKARSLDSLLMLERILSRE